MLMPLMRRLAPAIACCLLVGCAAPSPTPPSDAPQTESGAVTTAIGSSVSYGAAQGYLAVPRSPGPHPGIILIHEWWGLNDNIRWYAEAFAAQGYVALAVDLYDGVSTTDPEEAKRLAGAVREDVEGAAANLRAAVAYLRTLPDVEPDRLASVGWCFGGGWSYQMAKGDMGVKATVMYYGQFAPDDDLSMMKSHIIGHFGEDDAAIPVDDVKAFRAKLQTLSGENQVFIYENEGHGFARELTTESARTAWERTLEFLREQL